MGKLNITVLPDTVQALPVMAVANDIANALKHNDVMLSAEPGAGKSTGLPLSLLISDTVRENIILLEPRRLAARSVAARLASHLGEEIGQRIGLRMRFDTRVSAKTQLTVVTEGVLTRMLQTDPALDGISLVIFDEYHERSLHADLGLALCLEVKQALREDLRILLMSATLDSRQIQSRANGFKYFHCPTKQHHVETIWQGEHNRPLAQRVVQTILKAQEEQQGDILVFLPGVAEIRNVARLLKPQLNEKTELHLLHGNVDLASQERATSKAISGIRRIILSTSLAETSITIDGVTVVIDSGLERRSKTDAGTGAQRLETVQSSRASATQRAGRAGRTQAGVCYRLWSESGHMRRSEQWQPEILRADLSPLLLETGLWGTKDINDLPWIEAPPKAGVAMAEKLMTRLGLWHQKGLTQRGRKVATLPVHPRIGHMMMWAANHNSLELGCKIAALLEERSQLNRQIDISSDIDNLQSKSNKHRASQLSKLLTNRETDGGPPSAATVLAQAFPDWIAQRRPGDSGRFQLASGAGVIIDNESELAQCQWLAVAQLGGNSSPLRIFKAMPLCIEELESFSPELFENTVFLDWDENKQRVIAENRQMMGHLVAATRPYHEITNTDKAKALINGVRRLGITSLSWNEECLEWQARVLRIQDLEIRDNVPEWPKVDNDSLNDTLENWLLPWIDGIGTLKALKNVNLYKALNGLLDYQQKSLLEKYLPTHYTVPSGSTIRLSYLSTGNPVLSVRLQEMFGCSENPSIAMGQIPLKVELLSPALRPVQVTADLANFWTTSYPAVKKEMAGRYPKHIWPDDPLNTDPTKRAKPRKM